MATVPMIAPDGQSGEIPVDKVEEARQAGFQKAYDMTAPDGKSTGYIPEEKVKDAQKAGFRLANVAANPLQEGTYDMWDNAGHKIGVPYSKVQAAQSEGYKFDTNKDKSGMTPSDRFAKDAGHTSALTPKGGLNIGDFARGAVSGAKQLLTHPVDTLAGAAGQSVLASGMAPGGMYPINAPAVSKTAQQAQSGQEEAQRDAQQQQAEQAEFIKNNPLYAAGGIAAQTALTAGALKGLGVAGKGLSSIGTAAREAAMESPDVAAMKGLKVPPGSPKQLRMQQNVQAARQYIGEAQSLEDLQARIKTAQNDVWSQRQAGIEQIANKRVSGPDGPTTISDLDAQRSAISAKLDSLRGKSPEQQRLELQKGETLASLTSKKKNIDMILDKQLANIGVDSKGIRQAFAQIASIGRQVSGKSTLTEAPQPYGVGKMVQGVNNLSLTRPGSIFAPVSGIVEGTKDLIAGRPAWSGKPTDIAIREGFRNAGQPRSFGNPQGSPVPVSSEYGAPQQGNPIGDISGAQIAQRKNPGIGPPNIQKESGLSPVQATLNGKPVEINEKNFSSIAHGLTYYLRSGVEDIPGQAELSQGLNKFIDQTSTPKDMSLYRGEKFAPGTMSSKQSVASLKPGDVISNPNFTFATPNKSVTAHYGSDILYKISVPKGSKAFTPKVSVEDETVLPAGQKFEVLSTHKTPQGMWVVEMKAKE